EYRRAFGISPEVLGDVLAEAVMAYLLDSVGPCPELRFGRDGSRGEDPALSLAEPGRVPNLHGNEKRRLRREVVRIVRRRFKKGHLARDLESDSSKVVRERGFEARGVGTRRIHPSQDPGVPPPLAGLAETEASASHAVFVGRGGPQSHRGPGKGEAYLGTRL
ncbi:hypothetical protein THAOC_22389, partial [Thalassiosira oceanica]